jgi:hypothetical protein
MLLLLIVLMVILVAASALGPIHFDGHVLCRNGNVEVPVKNAEVTLRKIDSWFFFTDTTIILTQSYALYFCLTFPVCWLGIFDCDIALAVAKTDAEGAFSLEAENMELNLIANSYPYLVIKACRNESSCKVKEFYDSKSGLTVKNFNYFMDDEFCQHCEGGGECKNA